MSRASRLSRTELDITKSLFLLALFSLIGQSRAECTVQSESEKNILPRLKELQNYGTITFNDANLNNGKAKYEYHIGICTGVKYENGSTSKTSQDIGAYQEFLPDKKVGKIVGSISKADIKAGNNWMLLTYRGGDNYGGSCNKQERKAIISLICDPYNLVGNTVVIEEQKLTDECYYLFEVNTKVACVSKSTASSISVGSILCIIFFCLVILYLLMGFLYQRCVAGAKGIEQFPNISFWREFGNLVADGTDFVFRTKPPQEPRQYKGLGDDQLQMEDDDEDKDDHLLPM